MRTAGSDEHTPGFKVKSSSDAFKTGVRLKYNKELLVLSFLIPVKMCKVQWNRRKINRESTRLAEGKG